jgi:hypothetical protein
MKTHREEPCGRDRRASKSKFKQPQLLYVFFSSLAFDILFDHFFIPLEGVSEESAGSGLES